MKVLCVAEKPSIAKSITEILSGGRWDTVSSCFLSFASLAPDNGRGIDTIERIRSQICSQLRL